MELLEKLETENTKVNELLVEIEKQIDSKKELLKRHEGRITADLTTTELLSVKTDIFSIEKDIKKLDELKKDIVIKFNDFVEENKEELLNGLDLYVNERTLLTNYKKELHKLGSDFLKKLNEINNKFDEKYMEEEQNLVRLRNRLYDLMPKGEIEKEFPQIYSTLERWIHRPILHRVDLESVVKSLLD